MQVSPSPMRDSEQHAHNPPPIVLITWNSYKRFLRMLENPFSITGCSSDIAICGCYRSWQQIILDSVGYYNIRREILCLIPIVQVLRLIEPCPAGSNLSHIKECPSIPHRQYRTFFNDGCRQSFCHVKPGCRLKLNIHFRPFTLNQCRRIAKGICLKKVMNGLMVTFICFKPASRTKVELF